MLLKPWSWLADSLVGCGKVSQTPEQLAHFPGYTCWLEASVHAIAAFVLSSLCIVAQVYFGYVFVCMLVGNGMAILGYYVSWPMVRDVRTVKLAIAGIVW